MARIKSKSFDDLIPYLSDEKIRYDKTGWIMKEHGVTDSLVTIIHKATRDSTNHIRYICRCECGNYFLLRSEYTSLTKSCGCLQQKVASHSGKQFGIINIQQRNSRERQECMLSIGAIFGELTIVDIVVPQKGRTQYVCECSCGNTTQVLGKYLKSGKIRSCGCVKSKGENKIRRILSDNKIEFDTEVSFDGLQADTGRNLRYDFVIYEGKKIKCIIEYHGEQHYQTSNQWYSDRQKTHDALKENFCKQHKIPLIIIPYTEYSNLSLDYLKQKYHYVLEMQK